jgi:hypothetical protein
VRPGCKGEYLDLRKGSNKRVEKINSKGLTSFMLFLCCYYDDQINKK